MDVIFKGIFDSELTPVIGVARPRFDYVGGIYVEK